MALLPFQSQLSNRYWMVRHGRSIPNESGLIVADLSNGVLEKYALAPNGKVQAKLAGQQFLKDLHSSGFTSEKVRIYSSPFSRTRETAQGVAAVLEEHGIEPKIEFIEDLRERYFGPSMELQSADNYIEIWNIDHRDPMTGPEGGESAADVARRLANTLAKIEDDLKDCAVLIVSHGDPLQILQTILEEALSTKGADDGTFRSRLHSAIDPVVLKRHRKLDIGTGELRWLV